MKITYDPEVDAMYIYFNSNLKIEETKIIDEGFHIDVTKDGEIFGIEILFASKRIPDLTKIDFEIYGTNKK